MPKPCSASKAWEAYPPAAAARPLVDFVPQQLGLEVAIKCAVHLVEQQLSYSICTGRKAVPRRRVNVKAADPSCLGAENDDCRGHRRDG